MSKLPDLEGLAIFARVVELHSFAAAATELGLSKATVSKAIGRVETRLGTRLFNRTSRRLALTDAGRRLSERATLILAEAEAAESEVLAQSTTARGLVRMAAPMSFGLGEVAPLLPDFLAEYPEVSVDLQLSDAVIDLIASGYDLALRIAALPDSSMVARRLCPIPRFVVAAPRYLERRGRPTHPSQLAEHACLGYTHLPSPETWRFVNPAGEAVTLRPSGPMCANNADALMPALIAGVGIAVLPGFAAGAAISDGRLETLLPGWSPPPIALHLLMPPGGPRPARVEAMIAFVVRRLTPRKELRDHPLEV